MENGELHAPTAPDPATDPGARSRTGLPPRASTDYHAKYFAHELSHRCLSDGIDRLAGVVLSQKWAEAERLDGWADDLKLGLERAIKDLDRQIKALESQRNEKRRSLFEAQDEVDGQRDGLIASIEGKLTQNRSLTQVLAIRWRLA